MADNQGEIFKKFLKKKGIGPTRSSEMLSVSRQTIYQYFRTTRFDDTTVSNLVRVFPELENHFAPVNFEYLKRENEVLRREKEDLLKKVIFLQEKLLDKSISTDKGLVNDL